MHHRDVLEVVPLGGLGEFGLNMMVYRIGDDAIVVDAGMMFPGAEHLGIDAVMPDLAFLDDCRRIHGVLLTHAHEDHVGAVPSVLERFDVPVFGTPYTVGWVSRRLRERGMDRLARLETLPEPGQRLRLGPFEVEPIAAAHSVPQTRIFAIHTPHGVVLHASDFKLDRSPLAERGSDVERLAELGRDGVLLMLSDSTNADVPGATPSESTIAAPLLEAIRRTTGRVVVTTFASHVHRVAMLADLARRAGRRMAVLGTSVRAHLELAERLGVIEPDPSRLPAERIMNHPADQVLVVVAGSQGEPNSAMARVSTGEHPELWLQPGDTVIHAARRIPGSEVAIGRMINRVMKQGAEVIDGERGGVHVSGHAAADELRELIRTVSPRFFVPIHGEYIQLARHARLAAEAGLEPDRICLIETGDRLVVDAERAEVDGRVAAGRVLVDGAFEADGELIRVRRRMAGDGIVVPIVALSPRDGMPSFRSEVVAHGFVGGFREEDGLLEEARDLVVESLTSAAPAERADEALLKARVGTDLRRFFKRRTRRNPLVLPVIVEW